MRKMAIFIILTWGFLQCSESDDVPENLKTAFAFNDGSLISDPNADDYNPELLIRPDGHVILVFGSDRSGMHQIYFTESPDPYDGSGDLPTFNALRAVNNSGGSPYQSGSRIAFSAFLLSNQLQIALTNGSGNVEHYQNISDVNGHASTEGVITGPSGNRTGKILGLDTTEGVPKLVVEDSGKAKVFDPTNTGDAEQTICDVSFLCSTSMATVADQFSPIPGTLIMVGSNGKTYLANKNQSIFLGALEKINDQVDQAGFEISSINVMNNGNIDVITASAGNGPNHNMYLVKTPDVFALLSLFDPFVAQVPLPTLIQSAGGSSITDFMPANLVIGQPNMNSGTPGAGLNQVSYASDVTTDAGKIIIADSTNNRILFYNTLPIADGATADFAITNATSIKSVFTHGGYLYIGQDSGLAPDLQAVTPVPTAGTSFTATFQTGTATSGCTAGEFNSFRSYTTDGTRLFASDHGNNRIAVWNTAPTGTANADYVIGQANITTCAAAAAANQNSTAGQILVVGGKLIVADSGNNRVLIYNTIPTANNANADVVIGQINMTSMGTGTTANTLNGPEGVASDGTRLFIADNGNNRVLVYNTIPTSNNTAADHVLGQGSFTNSTANDANQDTIGDANPSANTMSSPERLHYSAGILFVTDTGNNRVLLFGI